MAQTVNWLFIFVGLGIGGPTGFYVEKLRVKYHRTRAGMRMAWPVIKMAGYSAAALVAMIVIGLAWLGVL